MKKQLLYTLCCAALFSCKKKDLPASEAETSPVFYLKCEVNGVPVNIQAGMNNYYMSSSHYQDSNNVYVYRGDLKQSSCAGACGYGITVLINNYRVSALDGPMQVDSGLVARSYGFNDGNFKALYYTCNFSPLVPSSDKQYEWRYTDGVTPLADHNEYFLKPLNAGSTYSVALFSYDPGTGCSALHQKVFKIGNPLQTNITEFHSSGQYTFSAIPSGKGPFTYTWNFGDGSAVSNLPEPRHSFDAQKPFLTKLTLTNGKDTCTSYYQIAGAGNCDANYISSFVPVLNPKVLSSITIVVTDQNGVAYSSSSLDQPSTSKFEIVSVENYKVNEHNESTKKLKITFNCTVNNAGNPIAITNGEAVIAVSYK